MRHTKRSACTLPEVGKRPLVFHQECEETRSTRVVDFVSFLDERGMRQKEGCLHIPERSVSLSPVNRESETFGAFRVDGHAVSNYVSTVDILHTAFLQSSVQTKHLLSALASQCFPLTGALHLTKVQLKTQGLQGPWAVLFQRWKRTGGDGQSPKGGDVIPLDCAAKLGKNTK